MSVFQKAILAQALKIYEVYAGTTQEDMDVTSVASLQAGQKIVNVSADINHHVISHVVQQNFQKYFESICNANHDIRQIFRNMYTSQVLPYVKGD